MSKGLRLTQKWMQRGLWLVAILFAGFLIGLGGKLVHNMWDVEAPVTIEQFIDPVQGPKVRDAAAAAGRNLASAMELHDQAEQKHQVARSNSNVARDSFNNWIATRQATARPDQDPELLARTRALDAVQAEERQAKAAVEAQQQAMLDATQARDRAAAQWARLQQPAAQAADKLVGAIAC